MKVSPHLFFPSYRSSLPLTFYTMKNKSKQKDLKKVLETKEQEIGEYVDHLQRLQADFENMQKRVDKEKANITELANAKLISKILPILDNFHIAVQNLGEDSKIKDGITMIFNDLQSTLQKEGVEPIDTKNKDFDPYQHEVLDVVTGKHDDKIVEELQKGYKFKGKVLRTSKVRISKKDVENKPTEEIQNE